MLSTDAGLRRAARESVWREAPRSPQKRLTVPRPRAVKGPPSAQVAALVGHELRTPLATALLYMNIAERHLPADSRKAPGRSALALAIDEVRKLDRLVARVIEIEREGRVTVRARPIMVDRVVRQAVRGVLTSQREPRSEVRTSIPYGVAGWWDDLVVEQIVQNLLSNALKFGRGRPVQVTVEAELDAVRLVVQDHGVGIPAVDRELVFGRSMRAPVAHAGGLGLGLWIVKKLVEGHRGSITVHSRRGQGSTFIVRLPQLRPPGK